MEISHTKHDINVCQMHLIMERNSFEFPHRCRLANGDDQQAEWRVVWRYGVSPKILTAYKLNELATLFMIPVTKSGERARMFHQANIILPPMHANN